MVARSLSSLVLALGALISLSAAAPGPVEDRGEEYAFSHDPAPQADRGSPFAVPFADVDDAYASGFVHMTLMRLFADAMDKMSVMGIFDDPVTHAPITAFTPCVAGYAGTTENNTFACNDLDLYTFLSHKDLGSVKGLGNDIWGWEHVDEETGVVREFGLVGQWEGTAFVEIVGEGEVLYLGRLHTQSISSIWRDIKVIGDHAYIGSEAEGHGIQVFDLHKLLDKSLALTPKNFSITSDLTAHYDSLPVGRSHNIVSHASKNLIVAVGSEPRNDTCRGGLIFVDVTDPANPTSAGCASEDGYTHDAQCLTYLGPDTKYNGSDICYAYNENSFTIYDITDPAKPEIISITGYYGVSYSHQGWVIDELDQRYVLLNDEWDELKSSGWANDQRSVTYIWDVQNLSAPVLTGHYKSPQKAIDHNLYVHNGLTYESNYGSGLRVVDVSSVVEDPTGAGFTEVAFFDVHPEDDDVGGIAEFSGAWSVYPYFKSGYILVNTIERGLFVLKRSSA